jgi:hypothetical protein
MEIDYSKLKHKGGRPPCGEQHPHAVLTEVVVREIRRLRVEGYSLGQIADSVGISRGYVSKIVNRQAWAHLTE